MDDLVVIIGLFGLIFFIGMPVATIYLLVQNRRLFENVQRLYERLTVLEAEVQRKVVSNLSARNAVSPEEAISPKDSVSPEVASDPMPIETSQKAVVAAPELSASSESSASEAVRRQSEESSVSAQSAESVGGRSAKETHTARSQQLTEAIEPDFFSKVFDAVADRVKSYFTEGNLIVRVGVIVLFFGVAFLLRYAAERSVLPLELRIACVALIGIVILVIGWLQRQKRRIYALVMQGGGVGILYMTGFACTRFYELLPAGLVFMLMIVMVVLGALLAILQNARALAILALTGGFMAPVLTATGEGSHLMLFSYFALLNAGIVLIAFYKHWRLLNLVGFTFTFVLASLWGFTSYSSEYYLSCQLFLILFFLFYAAIGTLFARDFTADGIDGIKAVGYVDGTLVFGLPLVAFTLQIGLVQDIEFGLAWSAMAAGVFYLLLTRLLWLRLGEKMRLLLESYLALGVVFTTLVIPFALQGEWIATVWALEGAGVLWVSLRQKRNLGAIFAIALQFLAGVAFFTKTSLSYSSMLFLNSHSLSALLVALSGLYSAYLLYDQYIRRQRLQSWHSQLSVPLLVWGLLWWFANGFVELVNHYHFDALSSLLLFVVFSVICMLTLAKRFQWHHMRYGLYALFVTIPVITVLSVLTLNQPFDRGFWLAWPITWVISYVALYWWEHRQPEWLRTDGVLNTASAQTVWPWFHAVNLCSLVMITSRFFIWLFDRKFSNLGDAWALGFVILPVITALLMILRVKIWPFTEPRNGYRLVAVVPLLVSMVLWSFYVTGTPGSSLPLPYVPLLNIIDLTQLTVFICWLSWWLEERKSPVLVQSQRDRVWFYSFIGGIAFIWLNTVLLRTFHHYLAIDYEPDALFESALVQAGLSVLWVLTGLALMVTASRKQWRILWLAAAALLGLVVAKLFLIDMADADTLASIISFIVVGSLLLVIGFVSPIPPVVSAEPTDTGPAGAAQTGAEQAAEPEKGAV
jgi:uncharacterized membrane protein